MASNTLDYGNVHCAIYPSSYAHQTRFLFYVLCYNLIIGGKLANLAPYVARSTSTYPTNMGVFRVGPRPTSNRPKNFVVLP